MNMSNNGYGTDIFKANKRPRLSKVKVEALVVQSSLAECCSSFLVYHHRHHRDRTDERKN